MLINILGKKVEFSDFVCIADQKLLDKVFEDEKNLIKQAQQEFADTYQVEHVNKYGKSFDIKE